MTISFRRIWIHLRSSFWFLPTLMMLAASALAVGLVEVDSQHGLSLAERYPRVFGANAEGARSILSSVASSMISIAGVTFSITIVALSLASNQYTSRILRNFMRDRANQAVLGVFLSIFVYCLVVLRTIRGGDQTFVPSLSVVTGILLGFLGIGFLIFFIHHVANSIQASSIICNIHRETLAVIDHLYPDPHGGEAESDEDRDRCIAEREWHTVPSETTGYVQAIDTDGIIQWAAKRGTAVRMERGIGEFAQAGKPICAVAGEVPVEPELISTLNGYVSISSSRTIEQDPAFGIRQLVDISLKALSPGVNDTTTAVTCLHYLGTILDRLGQRRIPPEVCRHEGEVRLIARAHTYRYLVDEALHQIRQDAKGNVAVHLAMLRTVEAAVNPRLSASRREVLRRHVERLRRVAEEQIADGDDQRTTRTHFEAIDALLGDVPRANRMTAVT